jgi:hypothetical protein
MMSRNEMGSGVMETTAGLSQVDRIVNLFTAPSKTFTDIRRNTSWWVPYALAVVLSLMTAVVIDKQVSFEVVVQNSLHDTPQVEENLAGQEPATRAIEIHRLANNERYKAYGYPALTLLLAAFAALGLWGTFNLYWVRKQRLRRCLLCGSMPRFRALSPVC